MTVSSGIPVEPSVEVVRAFAYAHYRDAAPIIESVLRGSRACTQGRVLAWTRGALLVQQAIDNARCPPPPPRQSVA